MPKDYSKYSLEDLNSALHGIDKEKYPENHQALLRAIEHRKLAAQEAPRQTESPVVPLIASVWRRLGAVLCDGLIWSVPALVIFGLTAKSFGLAMIYFVGSPVLYVCYQVFFHARYGATPGKMLLGIRVVHDDYSRIGMRTAVKRSIFDILLQIVVCIASIRALALIAPYFPFSGGTDLAAAMKAVGFLQAAQSAQSLWVLSEVVTCLFNRRRKAIHDYIAGTLVVRTR